MVLWFIPLIGAGIGAAGAYFGARRAGDSIQHGITNAGGAVANSITNAANIGAAGLERTGVLVATKLAEAGVEAADIHSKRLALAFLEGVDRFNTHFNATTLDATNMLCQAIRTSTSDITQVFSATVDRNVDQALQTLSARAQDFTAGMVQSARLTAYSIFGGFVVSNSMICLTLLLLPYLQANIWIYDSVYALFVNLCVTFYSQSLMFLGSSVGVYTILTMLLIHHYNTRMNNTFLLLLNKLNNQTTYTGQPHHGLAVCPIGTMLPYASSQLPDGWLWCHGGDIDLAHHPERTQLAHLLGNSYDPNGLSCHLPDMRGRVPLGAQAAVYPLGRPVGSATHVLTTQELPSHQHSINNHTEQFNGVTAGGNPKQYRTVDPNNGSGPAVNHDNWHQTGWHGGGWGPNPDPTDANYLNANHTHNFAGQVTINCNTTTVGQGQAISLIQPSLSINYIMKY